MPTNFNFVDTNSMRTAVTDFENTQAQLQQIRVSVQSVLGSLTSGWTGDTANQYQRLMTEWTSHFGQVYNDLGSMLALLNDNISNYERGDASNHESLGAIRSAFGN
ncbi:WXG100 family type VII secretion target [Kitasatospora herbaricolor]|uniref:WXG100 family type VII secretion target n=1 Tax=Kitasatospora herbaricolor TaxID=68217 RepID=UPI0036DEAA84